MLSSISSIQETIRVKNDFSFVDTLGSFIGNHEFHQSYEQFKDGQSGPNGFVWESLSAIGNTIGNKIFTNIRDYIDLVSNVDKCKVKNLQSMLAMYGQQYTLIDNINLYPLEVQDLIDLFSINKKYLLQNDFINDDFKNDLISGNLSVILNPGLSSYKDDISVDTTQFDSRVFGEYIKGTYKTLITEFLDLDYNSTNPIKIRKTLTKDDLNGYRMIVEDSNQIVESEIEQFKRTNNVSPSFNEKEIVDNIDNGTDFLDRYFGVELKVLEMEIADRAAHLNVASFRDTTGLNNTQNESVEQKTRYSYYRKAKVLEYYKFITNLFSTKDSEMSSIMKYDYDKSFFEVAYTTTDEALSVDEGGGYAINETVVNNAAETLKNITLYVQTLRERLKLQTRKNYMRGTSNLLVYLINQYMVDYAKTQTHLFNQLSSSETLSGLHNTLMTHDANNVNVVEYYDQTEYFNIKTNTDRKSVNSLRTNERYWERPKQTTKQFTDDEIENFYMTEMGLGTDSTISDFNNFLDAVFNLGANTSYVNSNGDFTTKLSSSPNLYSDTAYVKLTSFQDHWEKFSEYIPEEYVYPNDTVKNQISDIITNQLSPRLSSENLSAVSVVYDELNPQADLFSDDLNDVKEKFDNIRNAYKEQLTATLTSNGVQNQVVELMTWVQQLSNKINVDAGSIPNYIVLAANNITLSSTDTIHDNATLIINEVKSLTSFSDVNVSNVLVNTTNIRNNILDVDAAKKAYILNNVNQIEAYVKSVKTNDSLKAEILSELTTVKEDCTSLANKLSQFNNLAETKVRDYHNTATTLETSVQYIKNVLLQDVAIRTAEGENKTERTLTDVNTHAEYIENELDYRLSVVMPLNEMVEIREAELNFFDDGEYVYQKQMFDMYNGLCADSDMYYNYKNITHPSKQFHPYIWNLVEGSGQSNLLRTVYGMYSIQPLDETVIDKNIDNYIGTFGQQINLWKNDGIDYTGYSSGYEAGQNRLKTRTGAFSPIADYDGFVYPPARDFFRRNSASGCIDGLTQALYNNFSSNMSSFYVDYYQPLGLNSEEIQAEINRLSVFGLNEGTYKSPLSIILENRDLYNVNDIYKYGTDKFGNSYCLLKNYSKTPSDAKFKEKRNKTGRLWVRKHGYPLPYPAFAADDNGMLTINSGYNALSNKITNEISTATSNLKIKIDNGQIFDFEFSNDNDSLILVLSSTPPTSFGSSGEYKDASIVIANISAYHDKEDNLDKLIIADRDINKYETMENCLTENRYDDNTHKFFSLEDCIPVKSNNFYAVYSQKEYLSSSGEVILPKESKIVVVNYNAQKTAVGSLAFPSNPSLSDIAVSMCDENTLAVAAVVKSLYSEEKVGFTEYTLSNQIQLSTDVGNNPYNSHDVFESDVVMKKFLVNVDGMVETEEKRFNMNADMSYLPSYPGAKSEFDIRKKSEISAADCYPIELLGKSGDIDNLINMVNPSPDPYFDLSSIKDQHTFGRVYEDYSDDMDKTVMVIENPPINNNTVSVNVVDDNKFVWSFDLSNVLSTYTKKDYEKLRIVFYNKNTYGKNPYFVGMLSSLTNKLTNAYYKKTNDSDDDRYELKLNDYMFVTGTYDNKHVNSSEDNTFRGIKSIQLSSTAIETNNNNNSNVNLSIIFDIDEGFTKDNIFIDSGTLIICLLNEKDLTQFESYHFVDPHGCFEADIDRYGNYHNYYHNYYLDGQNKCYLSDFYLSAYDELSSVPLFNNLSLQFKYDEDIDLLRKDGIYYTPQMAQRFPRNSGQYLIDNGIVNEISADSLVHPFDDQELFVISPPKTENILSDFGKFRMDFDIAGGECMMVDESYRYETSARFSVDDSRIISVSLFTQSETRSSTTNITCNYENISYEDAVLAISSNFESFPLFYEIGDVYDTRIFDMDEINISADISKFLKLYVNYKKDSNDNITLYFNYINYINTPFLRIEDGKLYPEIIDRTYLKLDANQEGILDIVVQLRYVDSGRITSCKNMRVMSFKIYNVSDDKPKFIMREIYHINKKYSNLDAHYGFEIYGQEQSVATIGNEITTDIYWKCQPELESLSFDVVFDGSMFEIVNNPNQNSDVYIQSLNPSMINVRINKHELTRCTLTLKKNGTPKNGDVFDIEIDEVKVRSKDHGIILDTPVVRNGKITYTGT